VLLPAVSEVDRFPVATVVGMHAVDSSVMTGVTPSPRWAGKPGPPDVGWGRVAGGR
jgi:hypothetical protein